MSGKDKLPGAGELRATKIGASVFWGEQQVAFISQEVKERRALAVLFEASPDVLAALEGLNRAALDARNYIVNAPELRFTHDKDFFAESLYFAIREAMRVIAKAHGESEEKE